MEPREDIGHQLAEDHENIEALLNHLEALPPMDGQRRNFVGQMAVELVRHLVAEERYLHPVLRDRVPDGAELADSALRRHARIEDVLRELEDVTFGSVEFEDTIRRAVGEARAHTEEDRTVLLPRLLEHVTPQELADLDAEVRRVRLAVPTARHDPTGEARGPGEGSGDDGDDKGGDDTGAPSAFGPGAVGRTRALTEHHCERA
ncbi:hemerythrin domain-containing protein [Streptomyces sp. NPDC054796]